MDATDNGKDFTAVCCPRCGGRLTPVVTERGGRVIVLLMCCRAQLRDLDDRRTVLSRPCPVP